MAARGEAVIGDGRSDECVDVRRMGRERLMDSPKHDDGACF